MKGVEEFWRWFCGHEKRLLLAENADNPIFEELHDALTGVHPDLTFEIGVQPDGPRELMISAGGMIDAFPAVRAVVAGAPKFEHWHVFAFRQRKLHVGLITVAGVSLYAEDVRYTLQPTDTKTGITLYIPGYTYDDHSKFLTIGFLLLDAALGEYDVETALGTVDISPLGEEAPPAARPLAELPAAFDAIVSSRN